MLEPHGSKSGSVVIVALRYLLRFLWATAFAAYNYDISQKLLFIVNCTSARILVQLSLQGNVTWERAKWRRRMRE